MELSKQYRLMLDRKERGRCVRCGGEPRVLRFKAGHERLSVLCEGCWVKQRERSRIFGKRTRNKP